MKKIGIIGCGNLGMSIVKGVVEKDTDVSIIASKRNLSSLENHDLGQTVLTTDNKEVIENSEILIVALKPYNIISVLNEYKDLIDPSIHTVVSVASEISIKEIKSAVPEGVGVYRAMPNTAASVGESVTLYCYDEDPLEREHDIVEVFSTIGETLKIEESLMESATILGACGVAYVLRFMRAMIQGGIEVGFDAKTATRIVAQTMKGASELVIQNGSHPE